MSQMELNNADALFPSTSADGAGPGGRIGRYIDCSANPYDLRPASDIILRAAHDVRKTLPDDRPLVILMAENHDMPAHIELQHMVASRLLAQNLQFVFGLERPHNRWSFLADKGMNKAVPSGLYYRPGNYDPCGQAVLSAYLGFDGDAAAPVSHGNLLAFYYDRKISTIFNDAASKAGILDFEDPFTSSLARDDLKHGNAADLSDADCMAIRNTAMAHSGVERAGTQQKNIIVQQAGYAHLFGWAQEGCGYETSLCTAYRKAGASVLPVFITTQQATLNILPEAAYQELGRTVVIDGLARDAFYSGGDSQAERDFITEKLHKNSGGELKFYDVEARKEDYQALARAEADGLLRRYETARNPELPFTLK